LILLQASHIKKLYGATTILSDVTLTVQSGERVGLVGVNGAGKSTLLKIFAGQISYDAGTIFKAKGISVGYLSQDSGLSSDETIHGELLKVFQPLMEMETQLRTLEKQISAKASHPDQPSYRQLLERYDHLSESFKEQGGYSYQATVRTVMHGLDLHTLGYDTPVQNLSGGQKTLVALAKLLLQSPEVLMLDEPTNYLDINTLNWLEQYLKSYPGAILIVSHDRYLLDTLVNVTYELEQHQATRYQGNYSQYLDLKAQQIEQQLKQYQRQQQEVARLQDFVQRNIVRASTTKRAQSRRRMLEKMEVMDRPQDHTKKLQVRFDVKITSGKEVLKTWDLSIGYPEKILSQNINLHIERGESVALVGPNGVGKSTLLKTVLKELAPLAGGVHYGTNVQIAYYDQEQAKLHGTKQVLHELWDHYPLRDEKDIRTVLGNFLFSGEDVLKNVSNLSGGEKSRLALAKLLLKQANFLILDEPTNHLDIYSREVLENALVDFPGTILFVSHDRYFVNRVATRVIELNQQGVTSYLGDYDYYLLKKQQLEQIDTNTDLSAEPVKEQRDRDVYLKAKEIKRLERQKQRRIEELQQQIEQQESQIAQWEEDLCQPEIYQDHVKCQQLNDLLAEAKTKLDELLTDWLSLEEDSKA
jgi:ATP-binding cassette subfamily F protein 3